MTETPESSNVPALQGSVLVQVCIHSKLCDHMAGMCPLWNDG